MVQRAVPFCSGVSCRLGSFWHEVPTALGYAAARIITQAGLKLGCSLTARR
jgi:hypothetical protein